MANGVLNGVRIELWYDWNLCHRDLSFWILAFRQMALLPQKYTFASELDGANFLSYHMEQFQKWWIRTRYNLWFTGKNRTALCTQKTGVPQNV